MDGYHAGGLSNYHNHPTAYLTNNAFSRQPYMSQPFNARKFKSHNQRGRNKKLLDGDDDHHYYPTNLYKDGNNSLNSSHKLLQKITQDISSNRKNIDIGKALPNILHQPRSFMKAYETGIYKYLRQTQQQLPSVSAKNHHYQGIDLSQPRINNTSFGNSTGRPLGVRSSLTQKFPKAQQNFERHNKTSKKLNEAARKTKFLFEQKISGTSCLQPLSEKEDLQMKVALAVLQNYEKQNDESESDSLIIHKGGRSIVDLSKIPKYDSKIEFDQTSNVQNVEVDDKLLYEKYILNNKAKPLRTKEVLMDKNITSQLNLKFGPFKPQQFVGTQQRLGSLIALPKDQYTLSPSQNNNNNSLLMNQQHAKLMAVFHSKQPSLVNQNSSLTQENTINSTGKNPYLVTITEDFPKFDQKMNQISKFNAEFQYNYKQMIPRSNIFAQKKEINEYKMNLSRNNQFQNYSFHGSDLKINKFKIGHKYKFYSSTNEIKTDDILPQTKVQLQVSPQISPSMKISHLINMDPVIDNTPYTPLDDSLSGSKRTVLLQKKMALLNLNRTHDQIPTNNELLNKKTFGQIGKIAQSSKASDKHYETSMLRGAFKVADSLTQSDQAIDTQELENDVFNRKGNNSKILIQMNEPILQSNRTMGGNGRDTLHSQSIISPPTDLRIEITQGKKELNQYVSQPQINGASQIISDVPSPFLENLQTDQQIKKDKVDNVLFFPTEVHGSTLILSGRRGRSQLDQLILEKDLQPEFKQQMNLSGLINTNQQSLQPNSPLRNSKVNYLLHLSFHSPQNNSLRQSQTLNLQSTQPIQNKKPVDQAYQTYQNPTVEQANKTVYGPLIFDMSNGKPKNCKEFLNTYFNQREPKPLKKFRQKYVVAQVRKEVSRVEREHAASYSDLNKTL